MKYHGSCHCNEVQFEVEIDESKELTTCNCSICIRKGWLLSFIPDKHFKLISGQSFLKDYQFGKKHLHHEFCSQCGISCFSSGEQNGQKMFAINVRCLLKFDFKKYPSKEFDGKNL